MTAGNASDLFAVFAPPTYPLSAGAKEETTSREAANEIEKNGRAALLRHKVERWFRKKGRSGTADEVAAALKEDILSIRPRVSELHMRGKIEQTGERRKSSNGRSSHVWRWVR